MYASRRSSHLVNAVLEESGLAERLAAKGKVISLNLGDPVAYFPTPRHIIRAHAAALREGKTSYSAPTGILELREAIADRYKRMYGADLSPGDVIVTQGVSEGLLFLNACMIDKGESALLFRPYFTPYLSYLRLFGGKEVTNYYNEENGWSIDTEHLGRELKRREKKAKYLIITNPNNPTGTVLARNVLKEVVEIAKDNSLMLVSDEIYDELAFGKRFASIARLAEGIPHIVLNGMSKAYASTGFRLGYMTIPNGDRHSEAVKKAISSLASARLSSNTPSQYAFAAAMNNTGEHRKAVEGMRKKIKERTEFAYRLISKSRYISAVRPEGAFYIFPRLHMDKLGIASDREFVHKLLEEEQVHVARGSGFGAEGHIRIVTLADKTVLKVAIERIEKFCERHSRYKGGIV